MPDENGNKPDAVDETWFLYDGQAPPRLRYMPPDVAVRTYRANQTFYDPLIRRQPRDAARDVAATPLLDLRLPGQPDVGRRLMPRAH